MTPHEWFIEHRLDYATRTLDGEDNRTFEAHLPQCAECRHEIALTETDLAWLPMGLAPVAPRPGFRRRVIEHVLEGGRARRARWMVPVGLAASAALVASGWYAGQSRADTLRRALEGQGAMVAALRDTLSVMRQAGRVLQASVDVGEARGGLLIFADEVTHRWNVVIHGLPPAPAGLGYQFWFICDDGMVRGAEVAVDIHRPTMFTTGMPSSCPTVKGAALTVEPLVGNHGPPRGKALVHLML
ncbi:MAG: anti-sigma factor [Gemmatimonadales bacterium]|nr:anti-sigma factor [Gemmatimonadales bacterium]